MSTHSCTHRRKNLVKPSKSFTKCFELRRELGERFEHFQSLDSFAKSSYNFISNTYNTLVLAFLPTYQYETLSVYYTHKHISVTKFVNSNKPRARKWAVNQSVVRRFGIEPLRTHVVYTCRTDCRLELGALPRPVV